MHFLFLSLGQLYDSLRARQMRPDEAGAVRAFTDGCLRGRDGYVPLDQALWHWRREDRPATLPATVWLIEGSAGLLGTAVVCRSPIVTADGQADCSVITELAITDTAEPRDVVRALFGTFRAGEPVRALAAESHPALCAAFDVAGLRVQTIETAMVLPLTEEALAATASPPRAWVPLTESIVGL